MAQSEIYKAKVRALRDRELQKEYTAKLSASLVNKFRLKYGSKNSKEIQIKVDRFLKTSPYPVEIDLAAFEEEIAKTSIIPDNYKKEISEGKRMSGDNLINQSTDENSGTLNEETKLPKVSPWQLIDIAKQIEMEDKQSAKKKKMAEEMMKLKLQCEYNRDNRQKEYLKDVDNKKNEKRMLEAQFDQWMKEQEMQKWDNYLKSKGEKKIVEKQIYISKRRAEIEKEEKLRSEIEHLNKIKNEEREEAAKRVERRSQEKVRSTMLLQEAANQKIKEANATRESVAEEITRIESYLQTFDKDQEERQQLARQRLQRHDEVLDFWDSKDLNKSTREKIRKLELQQKRDEIEKDRIQREKETKVKEWRRNGCIQALEDNRKKIAEKLERKRQIDAEDMKYAEHARQQAEIEKKAAAAEVARKKLNMESYRRALDEQQKSSARNKTVDMTETEALLNADVVKKLTFDERLQQRVMQKLGRIQ